MRFLVLLALVAGAFASDKNCPTNSHYEECGTACPTTCENYKNPPEACVLMCVSDCFCDEGYVKTEEGKCVKPERCPSEEKNCVDEPDTGMCRGYFPMYYYDEKTGDCKQFIYGGCQGNGNRYATKEQCLRKCANVWESEKDRCSLKPRFGLCRGYFPKYFFDKASGQCKKFIYGGCGGNDNRFETEEECLSTCGNQAAALDRPDCDKAPETGFCRANFPRYYYDQEAGQCKKFIYGGCGGNRNNFASEEECYNKCGALHYKSREICNLEKEEGPCRAFIPRYFFNRKTGQCEKFIYGGCHGNENNFGSLHECENQCLV